MTKLENGKSLEPEFPNFEKIIENCKVKMKLKFFEYGNSWNNISISDKWWKQRLEGEIKEVFEAKDSWIKQKEIEDAINVLAMMWEKYRMFNELDQGMRGR